MSVDTEGKSLVELLDMLEPAPEPVPISMMPQTWGWLAIAMLVAVLIAISLYLFWRHRKANAYRRLALAELRQCDDDCAKVAEILKRTALVAFPRSEVAGLCGKNWLNFLQQTSDNKPIPVETGHALIQAPYRTSISNPSVTELARNWILTHKVGKDR
ncbi:DUF4381 domain-containing protein [Roseibium sp. RKSG952]|uniref:DUF4381 domain-containing protein n=1 Tax=Roseibium sp. RKSG952 TaxID=2529384 RepID=UPI0012BD15B8|nr:DUF4381 domain-containing protein [Roseibium sp. RKSG952]MTH98467.1 DUF4381 domain-containing protein [Roseibium sp. RKSG952]